MTARASLPILTAPQEYDAVNEQQLRAMLEDRLLELERAMSALEVTVAADAGGDVVGPSSATDNVVVLFDSTTGKLIKASSLTATIVKAAAGVLSAAVAGTDYYNPGGTDVALADGGTGASLTDPNADRILFWDDSGNAVTWLQATNGLEITGTDVQMTSNQRTGTLFWFFQNGGATLTTGLKYGFQVDFAGTIIGWTLGGDASGSITIDIWKDTYANFPPTVADTITASAKPSISAATKNTSTTLTGWTTSFSAGDWLYFNIDSITTFKYVTLCLQVRKT